MLCYKMFLAKRLLLIVVAFTLVISCINTVVQEPETQKIGFLVTSEGESDSTICVIVGWVGLLEKMPDIKINKRSPDISRQSPIGYSFSNIPAGKAIEVFISFENDSIFDSVPLPPLIDSVWCNDVYVPSGSDSVVLPYGKDSYILRWKTSTPVDNFIVMCSSPSFKCLSEVMATTDSIRLVPENEAYVPNFLEFSVAPMGENSLPDVPKPGLQTNRIFVYYDISGPAYTGVVSWD